MKWTFVGVALLCLSVFVYAGVWEFVIVCCLSDTNRIWVVFGMFDRYVVWRRRGIEVIGLCWSCCGVGGCGGWWCWVLADAALSQFYGVSCVSYHNSRLKLLVCTLSVFISMESAAFQGLPAVLLPRSL